MNLFEKLATTLTLAATFGLAGCPTTEGPYPSASGRYPVGPNPYSTRTPATGNPVSNTCHGAVEGAGRGATGGAYYGGGYRTQRYGTGTTGGNVAANVLSGTVGGLVGGAVRGVMNAVTDAGHEVCDPNAPADNSPPSGYDNNKPVQQIR